MWDQLRDVLTDPDFLQARLGCPKGVPDEVAATDIFEVLEDHVATLEAVPAEDAWREVDEVYRVLDGDSHALKLDTGIVLQQVYNALADSFADATPLGRRLRQAAGELRGVWLQGPAPRRA